MPNSTVPAADYRLANSQPPLSPRKTWDWAGREQFACRYRHRCGPRRGLAGTLAPDRGPPGGLCRRSGGRPRSEEATRYILQ